ncbi:MAG TPA: hypothetical protein DHV39_06605, partial [Verrucomicrobiales bacterium]|nr:hypothetical protein [Verrucomicrobiales bacterium]
MVSRSLLISLFRLTALCLVSLTLLVTARAQKSFDERSLTQKVKDAVVTIRHMDRAGNENGVGTGFVIDSE